MPKKIIDLAAAALPVAPTDLLPLHQAGGTRKVALSSLPSPIPAGLAITATQEITTIASGVLAQETTLVIPANAVVLGVTVRVGTQPGGTTVFALRGTGSGHQFNTADVSTVANSTDPGVTGCPFFDGQAETLVYLFDALTTDALGRITATLFAYVLTP